MSDEFFIDDEPSSPNNEFFIDNTPAREYSGWSDVPASVAANTWGGIKNTIGGGLEAVADFGRYLAVPNNPYIKGLLNVTGADKEIESLGYGDDLLSSAKQTLDDANQKYQFEPWSGSSIANRVGVGVGQMAPIVAAGMVTGGAGVVPLIGAQSFGSNYGYAQNEGQSSADSAYRGAGNALSDMAFGRLNTNAWFKPNLGLGRKVAESAFTNVITDPFQNITSQRINEATGAEHISSKDLNLTESALASGITGALLPIGTDYAMRQQAKFQDARSQADIDAIRAKMQGMAQEPPEVMPAFQSVNAADSGVVRFAEQMSQIDRAVEDKASLPNENLIASQLLSKSAQVAPSSAPRIIDINPEQPSGIVPVESSARTTDYQAELDAMMKPQTQLIVDAQGRPLNAPTQEPAQIVAPFTQKGAVKASLPLDEKSVIRELKLTEAKRRNLEAKALPAVIEPKTKPIDSADKLIGNGTFPKVIEYVQKNMPDKGAQEGFVNALKLQREAIESGQTPPEIPDPKVEAIKQIDQLLATDPDFKAESRPDTNRMLRDIPVELIDPKLLTLAKDIPNFKEGANERGIIPENELTSDDYRHGAGPVIGLRRLNGEVNVITGRHRTDLAKRLGTPGIKIQILNESDGVTPEIAQAIDAEMNILDDRGSVRDYVTFFKQSGLTEEAAKARGLLSGDKGSKGFAIGLNGTPALHTVYDSGRISDAKAAAIARGAPGDEGIQRVGLALASKQGIDENGLEYTMRRLFDDNRVDAIEGDQTSMFKSDDSAIQRMEIESRIISEKIKDINDTITAGRGSANRPEKASKILGAPIKDPEAALKRIQELLVLKEKWKNPSRHPEIKEEFAKQVEQSIEERKATNLKKLKKNLKDQRGWVINPFGKSTKEDVQTVIRNLEDKELQKVFKDFGKNIDKQTETVRKLGIEKTLENYFFKTTISPQSVADAEPRFQPLLDTAKRGRELSMTVAHDLLQKATDFIKQPAEGRMWEFAAAAREAGNKFLWTAENFQKLGATDGEIKGLMALRDTMDSALPIYRDILIREGMDPEKAQQSVDQMKLSNYVPFARFGDKFIELRDPETGDQRWYAKYETEKQKNEVLKRIEEIKKQNPGKNLQIIEGEFGENPKSLYGSDSANGFNQHLKKSFNVPGYQKNMKRAVSEYISSLSNFAAKSEMKVGFDEAFKNLPQNSPQLAKYAQEYAQYQMSNEGEAALARKVMTLSFLAGRISSAAINLTQQITTTLPRAQAEVGSVKALQYWGNSRKLLMERLLGGETRFAKNYPELNEAINTALKHGSISEQSLRELSGRARSASGEVSGFDKVMDLGMFFFDAAEKSNRYHSFLTGYQIAKDRGMTSADATRYGERFTDSTQFDYSKINRPAFARGKIGAPLTTFQLFKYNQIKFTKDLISASLKGDTKAMQGLATNVGMMVALAGLGNAFIGSKELNKILEANGIDGRQALRERLKDQKFLSDLLDNGITYAMGMPDMSGSLSNEVLSIPGEYSPEGIPAMLGKAAGGVPLAMGMKVADAISLASQGEYMKAFQAGAPSALSGMAKAFEAASEGKITNTRGQTTVEDPTIGELGSMALGFTPARTRDFYNRSRSAQLMADRVTDNDRLNERIAKARIAKDRALEQSIRAENTEANKLREHKSFPNPQAIRQFIETIQNPIEGQISRMPKDVQAKARERFLKPSLGRSR